MSEKHREKIIYPVEHEQNHESSHETESQHKHHETHHAKHESHTETPEQDRMRLESAKEAVGKEKLAESDELLDQMERQAKTEPTGIHHPPNKALKKHALNNYLSEIRSGLSGGGRAFSKFIHQPSVNAISEFSGKTIVRPTAILFAGIFMFAGSAFYLYATYHTDAQYNFFVALFLFFGGFVAGLIIELIYKLFIKRDF